MSGIVAVLAIAITVPAAQGAPPKLPPVVVHISDGPDNQCLITADGQVIPIDKPPPLAIRQQMLARGVRLSFAQPKPDFRCISGAIFPLQREGIDVRN
jgi:hypothetical protein